MISEKFGYFFYTYNSMSENKVHSFSTTIITALKLTNSSSYMIKSMLFVHYTFKTKRKCNSPRSRCWMDFVCIYKL